MGMLTMWDNRKRVLGMNERNLSYIKRYNSSKSRKIADDKLLTKTLLKEAGIPNPKLIAVINNLEEFREFDWDSLPKSFVVKPVSGLEGGGIEIFFNRDNNGDWVKGTGERFTVERLQNHVSDIIDGKYSLHNQGDRVFFEQRVRLHKDFQYYTHKGVPDVRVVVFNSIPIMGMLRLPTAESDGKGNLQMGAIGAGIDITSGVTTHAIIGKGKHIEFVPGTKRTLSGLRIPYWNKILNYAVEAQRASGLKLIGVDFLIDRDSGPMIIEINARPGLSIQLANDDGIRWRLRKARGLKVQSVEKGVRLGKDLFGGDVAEDIERISGKPLIGIYEDVTIYHSDLLLETANPEFVDVESYPDLTEYLQTKRGKSPAEIKTKAKIDTGADSTSMDIAVAKNLGYESYIEVFEQVKKELNTPESFSSKSEAGEAAKAINAKLEKIPDLPLKFRVDWVRSSHGISIRMYIPIHLKLGNLEFETMANIYDRSHLTYRIIVGRKSLGKFLVEPRRAV